jgi:drug/metabolite transporter (DMT)-like permease
MGRDRNLLLGTLAALIGATLFGMLGPLSRFGAEAGVEGVAFTAWRALLGAASLATLVLARGAARTSLAAIRGLGPLGKSSLALAAFMGLTLNASIFTAFERIPIALALMLFYAYPAGVVVTEILLGRERVTALRALALGLSSLGVVLVLAGGLRASDGGSLDLVGVFLGLVAAGSQVVFVTVSRQGYRSVPADAATLVILTTSAVGASMLAMAVGQADGLVAPLQSLEPWPSLIVAGVAAAGVASLLFLTAIRKIGGTRTGILMLWEPVFGVILAGLWLGEALAPLQLAGGALVLAGAVVLQLQSDPDLEPVVEAGAGPVI